MEEEGDEVAEEVAIVEEELVATHGTVSDTNFWANAVDANAARNVTFAMKKYYLKSKNQPLILMF